MKEETIYYRRFSPNYRAIKVTQAYIEVYKTHDAKAIAIPFEMIEKIAFRNRYNIQFVIYTKDKQVISMDAIAIDDIESLIEHLRTEHKTLVDDNFRYEMYQQAVESTNYTFGYVAFLFILLIVLFVWMIVMK